MIKEIQGIVSWFDKSSGKGFVTDSSTGQQYFLHYSAIQSNESFKSVSRGDEVFFTLYTNVYMSQVDTLRVKNI